MFRLTRDCLSANDQAVLDSIFNPLQIGGDDNIPNVFDAEITDEQLQDPLDDETPEIKESSKLEIEAVKLAENNEYDKALELFENAIKITPNKASLYNNRAQVLRLKEMDNGKYKLSITKFFVIQNTKNKLNIFVK